MTKFCNAKNQEKVFLLGQEQAASCCKSFPIAVNRPIKELLSHWENEHQLLAQGIEVESCEPCWRDERLGKESMRQQNASKPIDHKIEISVSNLCNHMCSYCSPKFSSEWEKSVTQFGVFEKVSQTAQKNLQISATSMRIDENFDQIVDYINSQEDNNVTLGLLGGEPLMQQQSISKVFGINPNKIAKLSITTNLNPPTNKFLLLLIDQYQPSGKLHLHVSIDATPSFNHVPRSGFDQQRFLGNLELLHKNGVKFDFMPVANALAVFDLHNFVPWMQSQNIPYNFNPLSNPGALFINRLPTSIRQQILAMNQNNILPDHLIWDLTAPEQPKVLMYEQYQYLTQYFERTKLDISSVNNGLFLEWWEKLSYESK